MLLIHVLLVLKFYNDYSNVEWKMATFRDLLIILFFNLPDENKMYINY